MAIFLKDFENHNNYSDYIFSNFKVLPNVSVCEVERHVHYNPYYRVKGVSLNISTLSLDTNETEMLIANVIPSKASYKDVIWSSSDNNVATVDPNGLVTAKHKGNAVITVTTVDGGFTAQCTVNVVVRVKGIILNKDVLSLSQDTNEGLIATVIPVDADNKDVIWSSSNENVATVDSNGVVSAISVGDAVITVRTVDGGFATQCTVHVTPHDYSKDYLTFRVISDGGNINWSGSTTDNTLSYSKDNGTTWTTANSTTTISVNAGDKILWKGTPTPQSGKGIGKFSGDTNVMYSVEGNAMSLLYGDDFRGQTSLERKAYAFCGLFSGITGSFINSGNTNVVSVENLSLPATTLADYCYESMFSHCVNLTTAFSVLPARTLTNQCYEYMFYNCTSLTTAPELPATMLADRCYRYMFYGCTSLTTAPSSIGDVDGIMGHSACYGMFSGCTSLTTAPELPATTLANDCYSNMFYGCTSLTIPPSSIGNMNTIMANNVCIRMFQGCTSLTTAPELPATTLADSCYESMFQGCTSLTTAPELSATTLTSSCYKEMFQGCTSLTTAPSVLPATTLASECYEFMFEGCSSLTTAPELPATTLANNCYYSMFISCIKLTTAPELPATTLANGCYGYMFHGCTSLTTAPELPATTLADGCYNLMFYNCTSLTTAPELPATTLANRCYNYMFYGTNVLPDCTNIDFNSQSVVTSGGLRGLFGGTKITDAQLDTILKEHGINNYSLPVLTLADNCYDYMFNSCISLTTAPELPATTLADGCYGYMFQGCTSLTTASELPATTLADGCYGYMFQGCSSLTTAPELPATTLASSCYNYMFQGCTSLTTAPELPATTLASYCYQYMFATCLSLTTAPELPATTLADYCYNGMFARCTSLKIAPSVLPATTLTSVCYQSMFSGCENLTTAPELPATTLAEWCYNGMFANCKSLTTAPELPATTLVNDCYRSMFSGCENMNNIKCMATNVRGSIYTDNWVYKVASRGTFTKAVDAANWVRGVNGIPSFWNVIGV